MAFALLGEWAAPPGASRAAAETVGVEPYAGGTGHRNRIVSWFERRLIQGRIERSDSPFLVIDPRRGLRIVDANEHYLAATMMSRRDLCGERMFDAFPDNPLDPAANGVNKLYASLCRAAHTGEINCMALQRYDVADASGAFTERYWLPTNTPIYDSEGRLLYLLHHVRNVTAQVLKTRAGRAF